MTTHLAFCTYTTIVTPQSKVIVQLANPEEEL
jgi:hypothetical protein